MHDRLVGRNSRVGLTLRGRQQAKNTAEYLAAFTVSRIVTSPQQRARETAAILAGTLQSPIETDPDFDELHFGNWTGMVFADLDKLPDWKTFNSMRTMAHAPGGESLRDAQTRALRALLALHSSSNGSIFAIVTHADVIRSLVAYFSGTPLDLFLRFVIDPASVSIVQIGDASIQVRCLNRTA